MNQREKEIYKKIETKLNNIGINYSNTKWLNSLKEVSNNKIKIEETTLDEIDDFIREEFKKYFKYLLIELSLCLNIVKDSGIVKMLNILHFLYQ